MRFTDERSTNLLARLFTYSPRTDERSELENYCTEALAWCSITSACFATELLDLIRKSLGKSVRRQLAAYDGQPQVNTQISFKGEDLLQEEEELCDRSGGRFDLLLGSQKARGFLIVIESKVKFDPRLEEQVIAYRNAVQNQKVRAAFGDFTESYIVTLTPSSSNRTSADGHISWGQVQLLVGKYAEGANESRNFQAFADFLSLNHLSAMNIPAITPQLMNDFQAAAPFLNSAKQLFARFKNDEVLKRFFRPLILERPSIDLDDNGAWYGVGDSRRGRWAYAGFFIRDNLAGLYIDAEYPGSRTTDEQKLGDNARQALKEAKRIFNKGVLSAGQKTWFHFAHELKANETADNYLEWFTLIFTEISKGLD